MKRQLTLLALLLTWGCTRPVDEKAEPVVLDLVEKFGEAEITVETGRLDIGTPGARAHLLGDWSWNEKDGTGTTFVWAGPGPSEIAFFVAEPRSLTVRFRCLPYRQTDGSIDAINVSINGSQPSRIDLREDWSDYGIDVSAESILSGINRLRLEYLSSPAYELERQRRDRNVAVAWDWIEFSAGEPAAPGSEPSARLLRLTPGSRVDYFFETPADATLVIDSISQQGEAAGTLAISSLQDGRTTESILEFDGWHRGQRLAGRRKRHRALPLKEPPSRWPLAAADGLVRLRLESTGSFSLYRPRVVTESVVGQAASSPAQIPAAGQPTRPRLVLLYVIDAFRSDHLNSYSTADERTPGLATFVQDAVVFETALAQSSWTKPTVASILTGLPPWAHGAVDSRNTLPEDLDTLPKKMGRVGYLTAAFSANGYVSETFGFHHGFDQFVLLTEHDPPASHLHREALTWLAEQGDEPVFLYIHSIDPHAPYTPAEPFRSSFLAATVDPEIGSVAHVEQMAQSRRQPAPEELEALRQLYSGEIASADQQFSALVQELKDLGVYDAALIVVMSDHGEEFFDHGSWTHGRTLHREVLEVPMLVKFPHSWGAGVRVADIVQQIDLLPTFEDLLGLGPATELPGRSLLCAVQKAVTGANLECATGRERPVFASVDYYNSHWVSVVLGDWKLILPGTGRLTGGDRLFDRGKDPAELDNIAEHYPVKVGYLSTLIRTELQRRSLAVAPHRAEIDEETEARLKALGYLE